MTMEIFGSVCRLPDGATFVGVEDLAAFDREYAAHGFDEAIRWADAYSAGIRTTVRAEVFCGCCRRSIHAGCRFAGGNSPVEFQGEPFCLLCFHRGLFPDSITLETCFHSENAKLLEALKHAGLENEIVLNAEEAET